MPPLPVALARALDAPAAGLPKRERTRRQLVDAAIQLFCARGVAGSTIQEIAELAQMTPGTVYNHFETKDVLVQAVATWLADTLCRRITDSAAAIDDGAQRMAIGNRRYLWLAEESPPWAMLILDVGASAPQLFAHIRGYALADLRSGVRQKRFRIASEAAAMDLIQGTVGNAMRTIAMGAAPAQHGIAVAATVLRGLGMPFGEALEVARRTLPPFPAAGTDASATSPRASGRHRSA